MCVRRQRGSDERAAGGISAYMLHRSAPDPASAMDSARHAGHEPVLCMPFGLTRSDETHIIARWRFGITECAGCGYSLEGLRCEYFIVCPECGMGSSPPGAKSPLCAKCGYCMAGIAVGAGMLRCPECGSASPFLR